VGTDLWTNRLPKKLPGVMPKVKLTDRFCDHAKPDATGRTDYFDSVTKGLALRTSSGNRTWTYHFTSPKDGKRARMTLGSYPATSLSVARAKAIEAKGHLDGGIDPRDALVMQEAGAMTVKALISLYLEKPKRNGKPRKSVKEIKRRLDVNVIPVIGAMKLADLHKRDITRVIAPIKKRESPMEATRVFEDLRALVRWAVGQGYPDRNPMEGMEPPASAESRDRSLTDDEIRTLWHGLPTSLARSKTCQRIVKLCLVTAQRVGEVAGMQSSELDMKSATWTIPASRCKNGHEHTVPLSPLAIELIKEALAAAGEGAEFIFPNPDGDGSLPASAVARTISRAHESDEERPKGRFGIEHWTAHDLRRTAVSGMAKLEVTPIVLGHVINHRSVTKAGVTLSAYNQYDYAKERRAALNLWAAHVQWIVQP
jgi:integrase